MACLNDLIADEMARKKFVWGESDCCLSVCNVLLATTGNDPAIAFRGQYNTKIGAHRFVVDAGGMDDLAASVCREMNWPEIAKEKAKPGDVGVNLELRALLIFDGSAWVAKSEKGLVRGVPVDRAWSVS